YPGADEAGGVLMARMLCRLQSFTPKIYIKYPSPAALTLIPSLEDRYLDTMVKYQIMAAGGIIVNSLKEADTVYIVNAAADRMLSSFSGEAPGRGIEVLRNGVEAIEFARYAASLSKAVIVGDITYGNGSPPDIYHLLNNGGLLFSVAGFAGWNTAANSVGSALAQGISYLVNGPSLNHYDFLVSRYIEDIGYCGNVRQKVMAEVLPLYPQYNYFDVKEEEGEMAGIIKRLLNDFLQKEMPEIFHHGKIVRLRMPWRRLYEIDLAAKYLK
ncbi:MAG: DUF4127 family protein, partial [Bacilli bacterium]|nr:DUF4127 family protein [Bacilli bacterium]